MQLPAQDLGASDAVIGVVSAFRPWLGMIAGALLPALADKFRCHRGGCDLTYLTCYSIVSGVGVSCWGICR